MFLTVKDASDLAKEAERRIELGFAAEDEREKPQAEQAMQRGWGIVCERGPEVIATVGKDLRVAVWLTEALLRLRGLGGLRDGLRLSSGLVEQYWDRVFPRPEPDDEDGDARLFPFQALDGSRHDCRVAPSLRKLALSDGTEGEPVRFWEYEKGPGSANGGDSPDNIERRLQRSAAEFKRDLIDDAAACISAAYALEQALEAQCGPSAPSFSGLRELVGQIADVVRPYAELPSVAEEAPRPAETPSPDAPSEAPVAAARAPANGLDRQSAFRQLEEIAAFFRRTEPHSPMAYALENLVRRGRMTLPELLRELISDDAALQGYFTNAGMQPPQDKSS